MKKETFICDTCNKAIDVPVRTSSITMFPRCVITKHCKGLLSKVNNLFVADEQYHNVGTSTETWTKSPLIYTHTQTAPRRTWHVEHNLGTLPIISAYVYNSAGQLTALDPSQYVVDSTTKTKSIVTFTSNYTGTIQCVARQSNTPTAEKITAAINGNDVLVTANNTIVLASKRSSITNIEITINSSPLKRITLNYDSALLAQTPWAGVDYISIANQRYKLFSISAGELFSVATNLTSFWISNVDNVAPIEKQTVILLSNEPHEHPVDKILSSVVEVSNLSALNQNSMSAVDGALYCSQRLVTPIYPPLETFE